MTDFIIKKQIATVSTVAGLYVFYYSVSPYEKCLQRTVPENTEFCSRLSN